MCATAALHPDGTCAYESYSTQSHRDSDAAYTAPIMDRVATEYNTGDPLT